MPKAIAMCMSIATLYVYMCEWVGVTSENTTRKRYVQGGMRTRGIGPRLVGGGNRKILGVRSRARTRI